MNLNFLCKETQSGKVRVPLPCVKLINIVKNRNSSGDYEEIKFQEVEIHIFNYIESFCKIVQEIEKAVGSRYFRFFFSLT